MSWVARRAEMIRQAVDEPGWGCVKRVFDRHIGRIQMVRKYGFPAGFYPVGSREYAMIATSSAQRQRAQTSRMK